jgi:hypothetical protein
MKPKTLAQRIAREQLRDDRLKAFLTTGNPSTVPAPQRSSLGAEDELKPLPARHEASPLASPSAYRARPPRGPLGGGAFFPRGGVTTQMAIFKKYQGVSTYSA